MGIGIGAPWRGRQIDRIGLRRALVPSIIAQGMVWPVLGFAPYWVLFPVVFVGGILALPIFSVVRKALSVMVESSGRRTAFALESVCTEIVFMIGPAVGVWLATMTSSTAVLVGIGVATCSSGCLLWWFNPPMSSGQLVQGDTPQEPSVATSSVTGATNPVAEAPFSEPVATCPAGSGWMSPAVVVVLAVSAAAAIALAGTDVGVLAQVRELDQAGYLGLAFTIWCASSAIGGLAYGAQHRSISPVVLVLVLGVATAPLVFVNSIPTLFGLLVLAGFACAPVMAATSDALTRLVPEERRGEAMGWQGSAFTIGSAVGSPIAGLAIDRFGAAGGFGAVAVVAVLVAGVGALVQDRTRPRW